MKLKKTEQRVINFLSGFSDWRGSVIHEKEPGAISFKKEIYAGKNGKQWWFAVWDFETRTEYISEPFQFEAEAWSEFHAVNERWSFENERETAKGLDALNGFEETIYESEK